MNFVAELTSCALLPSSYRAAARDHSQSPDGWMKAGVTLALAGAGPACVQHAGTLSHSHRSHWGNTASSSQVDPLTCSSSEEIPLGEHGAGPAQTWDAADFVKPVWKTAVMAQKVC